MAAELASGFAFLQRMEKQEASCLASRAIDVLQERVSRGWLMPIMQFSVLPVFPPAVLQPDAGVGRVSPNFDLSLSVVAASSFCIFSVVLVSILYKPIDMLTWSFGLINSLEI